MICSAAAMALLFSACRKADEGPTPSDNQSAAGGHPIVETWDAFYLKDAKIGYGHTIVRPVDRQGKALVETESLNHLKIERFGQAIEQDLKLTTVETPGGQLLEFQTNVSFGPSPVVVTGQVDGQKMVIETNTQGVRQRASIPWADDIGGFLAIERSLEEKPLEPGDERTLRMLMPLVNQVASVTLVAHQRESTQLIDGQQELLRIESLAKLADGNEMTETLWTDPRGRILKRRVEGIDQQSYRTTREQALADSAGGATFDLGTDTLVKLAKPLPQAHQTRRVRYRVELPNGDPARLFATCPTQSVRSLGPHVAEITVSSVRPGDPAAPDSPESDEAMPAEYTSANNVLQVDDPRIQQMAAEARGTETDPVKIALALERYVKRTVVLRDFSQAFATAAEVAETRSGDCTEHAVLLAALARACHIPARVAIGLVYVEQAGGFGYHMWTEMYLDGRWVPLDATLGQGGIGAAHLKLVDSSLEGATAYSAFLPVAQVVGQLKLDVLDAE